MCNLLFVSVKMLSICTIYFNHLLINFQKQKTMFDKKTFITVIIALVAFKLIDRLFLNSAMDKFLPESYEAYEGED